ncbi:MAG TPA: tyrosine-type recombinase/integrase [Puia sp.]|uniref:site-specific integrase n=1 Tax=Puia sp. TaxID=2045100 RepID=UPI002C7EF983|nr:tyrosine-type recombinase/integrase [Puia sp.]HVU95662.1 tyrosine-type recombinase/integrase [Puia sp.]
MSKSISILAYLKRQKKDAKGFVPLYIRVTIDGDVDEFSLSRKILPEEWSQPKQKCIAKSQAALLINARITKIKGDLTALFDRIPISEPVKTKQLIKLYHGSDSEKEQQLKKDRHYHKQVLTLIDQYLGLKNKEKKAHKMTVAAPLSNRMAEEFDGLIQSIEDFLQQSRVWMDDPVVDKTLMDAQYTFLLKFLYKVLKGTASHETFRKWVSTKNTFQGFLQYRYKVDDQPLKGIPLKFAVDLQEYLTLTNSIGNNAAMKYIKNLKQVIDDAVVQGWLAQNPLESFKCTYIDPERQALTLDEVVRVIGHEFKNARLSEVRDVFIFCCFTGFAYQEVYNLRPKDLTIGIDKKNWINTNRNKTKNPEFLPLLPIAEDLILKYRSHPYCVKYKKLLPVNSNQRFNEYLEETGASCKIDLDLTTHTARHTFATTIAIEHDIPLKIVSVMLGHRTQRTTEIYARASKPAISRHMSALQEKLFGKGRQLQVNEQGYSIDLNLPDRNKTKKVRVATK